MALHAFFLAVSVVPVAGRGIPPHPAPIRLSARLMPPAAAVPAPSPPPSADPPLPPPAPDPPKGKEGMEHPGPKGAIESPLSSPYLGAAEVDVRASPIDPPPLTLPEFVLRHHVHGRVELKAFIGATGRVDAIEVISSSHPGKLEEAAIEVVTATRFSPAQKSGVAVRSIKRMEVIFDPDEPGTGAPPASDKPE